ncbi:hypothetical protein EVAR_14349_1 [Eumeta japonica]|uniref:Uncharacterized protein n=1 Tax=Eumeta variegata TaxID=151549 RepID=A0A4C1TX60_EUMVA|nr:hypothetical protein EVAR_14349_1 [Eumeta japonica]
MVRLSKKNRTLIGSLVRLSVRLLQPIFSEITGLINEKVDGLYGGISHLCTTENGDTPVDRDAGDAAAAGRRPRASALPTAGPRTSETAVGRRGRRSALRIPSVHATHNNNNRLLNELTHLSPGEPVPSDLYRDIRRPDGEHGPGLFGLDRLFRFTSTVTFLLESIRESVPVTLGYEHLQMETIDHYVET